MLVVVDTNILVSALWSKNGAPAQLLDLILNDMLTPCHDNRIMTEYREVLLRPKFGFSLIEVNVLLDWFNGYGKSITAPQLNIPFTDKSDKKFYEVARACNAKLITGNLKHFPQDPLIITVNDFLLKFKNGDAFN